MEQAEGAQAVVGNVLRALRAQAEVGQAEVGNALHILQVHAEVDSVLLVLRVQAEAMGWVLTAAASQTFKIIPLPGGGMLWVLIAAASQNFQKIYHCG